MLLEDALDKYPWETRLQDGTPVVVRPLNCRDDVRLQKFFLSVPEEERLFVKQPITDRTLFRQWCRQPDFERPAVADAAWPENHRRGHVASAGRRGKRHVGLLTVLTIWNIAGDTFPKCWSPS